MSTSASGKRIVFTGAGNVATHIAPALDRVEGIEVVQVYSRSLKSAETLAARLSDASATDSLDSIDRTADIYIVSLVDDAVAGIACSLPRGNALWLHTSGSLPVETLSALSPRHGVFYPLQTFSKKVEVDVSRVPLFVEGSTPEVEDEIFCLARSIADKVYRADGNRRRKMHLAAVFACNFVNHLWTVADNILRDEGLSLEVLHPLLDETLRKAKSASPGKGQTGPAVRGDSTVMDKHMSMLPDNLAEVYRLLSETIYNYHHKDEQD